MKTLYMTSEVCDVSNILSYVDVSHIWSYVNGTKDC